MGVASATAAVQKPEETALSPDGSALVLPTADLFTPDVKPAAAAVGQAELPLDGVAGVATPRAVG